MQYRDTSPCADVLHDYMNEVTVRMYSRYSWYLHQFLVRALNNSGIGCLSKQKTGYHKEEWWRENSHLLENRSKIIHLKKMTDFIVTCFGTVIGNAQVLCYFFKCCEQFETVSVRTVLIISGSAFSYFKITLLVKLDM